MFEFLPRINPCRNLGTLSLFLAVSVLLVYTSPLVASADFGELSADAQTELIQDETEISEPLENETLSTIRDSGGYTSLEVSEDDEDDTEYYIPDTVSLSDEVEEAIIGTYHLMVFLIYGVIPLIFVSGVAYLFYRFIARTFS